MRTKAARRCIVCQRHNLVGAAEMCGSCGDSYDRSRRRTTTIIACIRWAAARARRFALKGK